MNFSFTLLFKKFNHSEQWALISDTVQFLRQLEYIMMRVVFHLLFSQHISLKAFYLISFLLSCLRLLLFKYIYWIYLNCFLHIINVLMMYIPFPLTLVLNFTTQCPRIDWGAYIEATTIPQARPRTSQKVSVQQSHSVQPGMLWNFESNGISSSTLTKLCRASHAPSQCPTTARLKRSSFPVNSSMSVPLAVDRDSGSLVNPVRVPSVHATSEFGNG